MLACGGAWAAHGAGARRAAWGVSEVRSQILRQIRSAAFFLCTTRAIPKAEGRKQNKTTGALFISAETRFFGCFWYYLALNATATATATATKQENANPRPPPRWPNARNPRNQGARVG